MNMSSKKERDLQIVGRWSNGTVTPAIYVAKDALVIDLKVFIEALTNIAPSHQRFIFNGKLLDDDERSLASYMIRPMSTLQLQVRPRGVNNYNPTLRKKYDVTSPWSFSFNSSMFSHKYTVEHQVSTPDVDTTDPHETLGFTDRQDGITTHNYNQTRTQNISEVTPPCGPPCRDQEHFGRQFTIDHSESFMFSHNIMSTGRHQVNTTDVNTTDLHVTPTHEYYSTQAPKAVTQTQLQCVNHGNSDRQCTTDDRAQSLNSSMSGHLSPCGPNVGLTNEYADNTTHPLRQCEPSDQNSQSFLSKFFDFITGLFSYEDPCNPYMDHSYGMISTPRGSGYTYLNNHAPPTY